MYILFYKSMRINTESRFVQLLGSVALGYAINFVLALVVSFAFKVPTLFNGFSRDIYLVLLVAFFVGFYGMGLGLLAEMLFYDKAWREKLPLYFLSILCSPILIALPMLNFIILHIEQFYIFAFALPSIGLFATFLYMYCKSFSNVDIVTYAVGYIFVFLGLLLGYFVWISIYVGGQLVGFFIPVLFNLLFPIVGVGLCKLFFGWIKKDLVNEYRR